MLAIRNGLMFLYNKKNVSEKIFETHNLDCYAKIYALCLIKYNVINLLTISEQINTIFFDWLKYLKKNKLFFNYNFIKYIDSLYNTKRFYIILANTNKNILFEISGKNLESYLVEVEKELSIQSFAILENITIHEYIENQIKSKLNHYKYQKLIKYFKYNLLLFIIIVIGFILFFYSLNYQLLNWIYFITQWLHSM